MSDSFIGGATKLNTKQVGRELQTLIKRNMITVYKSGNSVRALEIGLNKNYEEWLQVPSNPLVPAEGVDQDHETAFVLYTRSADQGFPCASFEFGKMLRDGAGRVKNQQDSDRRFKEALLGFVSLEE